MIEQFTPWDSAEYLQTEEDIAAYLDACFEEAGADAGFILRALENVARAKGMDAVAERAGLAPDQLRSLLGAGSSPEFGTVLRVLAALGIRLHADKAA
jgi:probable addiction module antidote protein